jgi:cephalosporin hydroxylase
MAPPFLRRIRRDARELVDQARFRTDRREARAAARDLVTDHTAAGWLDVATRRIPGGCSQNPQEIVEFIEFARSHQPRTFVEIGTQAGGTNFLVGRAVDSIERVVAVDLFVHNRPRLRRYARNGVQFTAINGDSTSPTTVARVARALRGHAIDLLFIDGDHSLAGALADLRLYRPLVAPDGLIAFHDIVPDERLRSGRLSDRYAGEVPLLWDRLRAQFPHHEFVASWAQEGLGIGVIENVPGTEVVVVPGRPTVAAG